jgi:AraC family transcriptional regulator of adaptative response/methylated-DNA-[protein]-cysteine methyltransferase
MLDPVECEQAPSSETGPVMAASSRSAHDGRVLPASMPVRLARGCNVEFFPSAAAAEVAGYRPCLRCRPETAPFSPAWRGLRTTVEGNAADA